MQSVPFVMTKFIIVLVVVLAGVQQMQATKSVKERLDDVIATAGRIQSASNLSEELGAIKQIESVFSKENEYLIGPALQIITNLLNVVNTLKPQHASHIIDVCTNVAIVVKQGKSAGSNARGSVSGLFKAARQIQTGGERAEWSVEAAKELCLAAKLPLWMSLPNC